MALTSNKSSFGVLMAVALGCAVQFSYSPRASASEKVITHDLGGHFVKYREKAKRLKASGTKIKIDGTCTSACLVYLMKSSGLEFCATPRAKIGFHMPFSQTWGRVIRTQEAKDVSKKVGLQMLAEMPPKLAKHFQTDELPDVYKGSRPEDVLWVKGADAQAAIGACV